MDTAGVRVSMANYYIVVILFVIVAPVFYGRTNEYYICTSLHYKTIIKYLVH